MENLFNNTILIVDDTPENIDILAGLLEDFDKQIAINGEDALETAFEAPHPDLILLDIMMPDMDGYEVCRRLRQDERTKDIPVIFLTAKTEKDDIVRGFEAGGQDYITKPFDARELMERVKTQLELKTQREILKNMNEILEDKIHERTFQLKEAMEKLDKANKSLQGLDTAKNNFLLMISHEIRTPLNGIVGAAYLLKDLMGDNTEFGEFIDMLKTSVDRLEQFSTTALVITQLQADSNAIRPKPHKIGRLIDSCIETLAEYSTSQGVEIIKEQFDPVTEINIEEMLVQRALKSIIQNGIKYSPVNDRVVVNAYTKDDKVIIDVMDNGRGFTEEALNNLFQPFGMGEEHNDKNVGLSLRAAKMIMTAHNGDILIENFPTSGAKVSLVFNSK